MNRTHRIHRLAALIAIPSLTLGLSGCAGLALANRGASDDEMKTFEVELSPVNLDAHTAHTEGHDDATAAAQDDALPAHDHNAADHDIDEHMAFLEQQAALEADPAMAPPAQHGVVLAPYWTTFPESGWVHGFDFELVDSNGHALPSEVLHHLQVLSPKRRDLFSPVMLRIAGAGGETQPMSLPPQVGYPILAGDSVVFTAMLHNPTGKSLGDVRLNVRFHYSPAGGSWQAPADVVPFFTHVTAPLEDSAYDLPPGRSERSLEVRPSVSGQVLAMGGHLHRYGESLRIEDAETGEILWEKKPVRADDGTVLEVPDDVLVWNGAFDLVSGHAYRVTAVYDNPTGQVIPAGGMGTVGGVIRPRGEWPAVDTHDVEYLWDVEKMLGSGGVQEYDAHASH